MLAQLYSSNPEDPYMLLNPDFLPTFIIELSKVPVSDERGANQYDVSGR